MTIAPALDKLVYELYEARLGRYWDPERKLVESGYRDVAFPFAEIPAPSFAMNLKWTFEHLVGYLGTWSALKRHIDVEGSNPLEEMFPKLQIAWGSEREHTVTWPVSVRAFRL